MREFHAGTADLRVTLAGGEKAHKLHLVASPPGTIPKREKER
jgi:hypothetical protein